MDVVLGYFLLGNQNHRCTPKDMFFDLSLNIAFPFRANSMNLCPPSPILVEGAIFLANSIGESLILKLDKVRCKSYAIQSGTTLAIHRRCKSLRLSLFLVFISTKFGGGVTMLSGESLLRGYIHTLQY